MSPKTKLAELTPAEEKTWQTAFEYHLKVGKQGADRAAARAWRDCQREFPRLRRYDGATPGAVANAVDGLIQKALAE